jgi:hypothetical protein
MKPILKVSLAFFVCVICGLILLIHEFNVGVLSVRRLATGFVFAVLSPFVFGAVMLLLFMKKQVVESLRSEAMAAPEQGEIGASHSAQTFANVWYSPRKTWHDLHLIAYRDIGKLTIKERSMEFEGRSQKLILDDIRRVSFGKQGRDFVNNWVRVDYGDDGPTSTALFADGNMLGWRGVFGGTRRIFDFAKHLDSR